MVNTQLLEQKIADSGLKIGHIAKTLGLTRQGFDKKRKGKTSFRLAEVYVLCDLLHISGEEKVKIFFPL